MHPVWFWTFWHWSKEGFRAGRLLRAPLPGLASHWDEWFNHEASTADREAVAALGNSEAAQRDFVRWISEVWAEETGWQGNQLVPRFVLGQLAKMQPFADWPALAGYRKAYGVPGVQAIILAEDSRGHSADVRSVEALVLPRSEGGEGGAVVCEGFQADPTDLASARDAALQQLGGGGFWRFALLWLAIGRRPYAAPVSIGLALGWGTAGALLLRLTLGPDPGERLALYAGLLAGLWALLTLTAAVMAAWQILSAWRDARRLAAYLAAAEVRLRLEGGLTLRGGSAGLPFCLNILLGTLRARPALGARSWLWRTLWGRLQAVAPTWAATGVVTPSARLKPVLLHPKLRACLGRLDLRCLLTPRQRGADQRELDRLAESPGDEVNATDLGLPGPRLGYATERGRLRIHAHRTVAGALLALAQLGSRRQLVLNGLAVVISAAVITAVPDIRAILQPPPAPALVRPVSTSPYYLWVSLDTDRPEYFQVLFQSDYWANRRADIRSYSTDLPPRAELFLNRLIGTDGRDEAQGVIWVERRRRFLGREFVPLERVGHYSFTYLNSLGHD